MPSVVHDEEEERVHRRIDGCRQEVPHVDVGFRMGPGAGGRQREEMGGHPVPPQPLHGIPFAASFTASEVAHILGEWAGCW